MIDRSCVEIVLATRSRWRAPAQWILVLAISGACLGSAARAGATPLTWDTNAGDGAAITGGTGSWTNGAGNWNNGAGDASWNNANPDDATFTGTAGTVTLGSAITAGTVTFSAPGYTVNTNGNNATWTSLAGTGGFTKDGAGIVVLNGASSASGVVQISAGTVQAGGSTSLGNTQVTLNGGTLALGSNLANDLVLNNTANVISVIGNYRDLSGQLSGTGGFTLSGSSVPGLILSNPANNFQGNVAVNGATYLRLTASEVLPNTTTVVNNGNLRLDVPGGGTETIAGLSGSGSVWVPMGNNTLQTLVIGANDTSSSYAGKIGDAGQNNDYLKVVKTGDGMLTLGNSGNAWRGGLEINGGVVSVNQLAGGNTPSALGEALGTSAYLSFNGGTLQYTGPTVTGVNRAFLINAGGATLDITQPGTSVTWTDASGAGPITGPGGLTKIGAGTLVLPGTNNYTGVTRFNGGTIEVPTLTSGTGPGPIGAAPGYASNIVFDGGTLKYTGVTTTWGRAFTLHAGGGTINVDSAGTTLTLAPNFTSAGQDRIIGPGGLTKTGAGTLQLNSNSSNSVNPTFNGGVTVNQGTLVFNGVGYAFNNTGGMSSGGSVQINSGGTVRLAQVFTIGYATPVTVNGGTLHLTAGIATDGNNYMNNVTLQNGGQITGNPFRAGYHSNGIVNVSGTSASTISSGIVLVNNAGKSLTLDVADATSDVSADLTISGIISDYSGLGGTQFIKIGAGTVTLSASNTYVGATSINAGTLELTGTGAINSTSGILINGPTARFITNSSTTVTAPITLTQGTIGGSGAITAPLTIGTGGVISPGNSPGTLTTGSETWAGGGTYLWEINSVLGTQGGTTGWDWIDGGAGALTLSANSGSPFTIDIRGLGAIAGWDPNQDGEWVIASFGSINGFDSEDFLLETSNFGNPLAGTYGLGSFAITQVGTDVVLSYAAAVPEPSTLLLAGVGLGLLCAWRRKRKSA